MLVSDTHSCWDWTRTLPAGDVFIHSGDLTLAGTKEQLERAFQEIKSLPHKIKLVIAGNHDLGLDRNFVNKHAKDMESYGSGITPTTCTSLRRKWTSREATSAGIIFLDHETTTIKVRGREFKVFGSPFTAEFFDWAFMYPVEQDIWGSGHGIPEDADILITHGPPKGLLDEVIGYGSVGCPYLLKRLDEVRPKLHVFGHIHEGAEKGMVKRRFGDVSSSGGGGRDTGMETIVVNAALLDAEYQLAYAPTVIDL